MPADLILSLRGLKYSLQVLTDVSLSQYYFFFFFECSRREYLGTYQGRWGGEQLGQV